MFRLLNVDLEVWNSASPSSNEPWVDEFVEGKFVAINGAIVRRVEVARVRKKVTVFVLRRDYDSGRLERIAK